MSAHHCASWQVILVKSLLLIAKIDADWVSETIPLHEIARVAAIVGHGLDKMMQESNQASMSCHVAPPKGTFAFQIFMNESAAVGARSYSFRADTKKDCDEWVKYITKFSAVAVRAHQANDPDADRMLRWRIRFQQSYASRPVQVECCKV
jgi:hypothetical protein